MATKDWPDDKRAVSSSIQGRETGRWGSRSRGKRVAGSEASEARCARKNRIKRTEKIVTGHTEEEIKRKKEEQEEGAGEREDNSPSTPKFFREVRGVGHYRGSHTSFASLPLLRRSSKPQRSWMPAGQNFRATYVRRELKIYPLWNWLGGALARRSDSKCP